MNTLKLEYSPKDIDRYRTITAPLEGYRRDIDGLRAIAVFSVILFHMGFLPNGYLGVDIFFTISGYLITKIVYNEALENRFSIISFYLRRIRRIIPLVLFTTSIALITGLFVMLPDDFQNLSESVFATNCFINNILQFITTHNYWDVVNEYKPLMHTWSLGIEEQFYLTYPIIFLFLNGKRSRWILPVLSILTVISLFIFISSSDVEARFYMVQFRFFELSLGGIAAIIFKYKSSNNRNRVFFISIILFILLFGINLPSTVKLLLVVISSAGLLIPVSNQNRLSSILLENRLMVGIGKISFSLYMWHQILLAFTRYFILEKITIIDSIVIFIVLLFLSVLSYFFIEQPFRDKKRVKTKRLLIAIGTIYFFSCVFSLCIYVAGGVTRNVPELEIYTSNILGNKKNIKDLRNINTKYNERIYNLDKKFTENDKIKVLIIGNSFARDWANILLESKYGKDIDISYIYDINTCKDANGRLSKAKYIFFSELPIDGFHKLMHKFSIDASKVWNVGTKNFGLSNGIFFNKRRSSNYSNQRTRMEAGYLERNSHLKSEWGDKYIDLIGMVIDSNEKVPVFTPDCKFISQDCHHLTHAGAVYFSQLLDTNSIFQRLGI